MQIINNTDTKTVSELTDAQVQFLIKELDSLNPNLKRNFQLLKSKLTIEGQTNITDSMVLEGLIIKDPVLWSKVYLDWEALDYQKVILREAYKSLNLVTRLGRQLGKTTCACVFALWASQVQPNKSPTKKDRYTILVIAPYQRQVDEIFSRLTELISQSPFLQSSIERSITHKIEFLNGSVIKGMTAGAKTSAGAPSIRGQSPDILLMDEVDYMGSKEISTILNARNSDPSRIKTMCMSTPSGKRQEYYKWCTKASISYTVTKEDVENFEFNGYVKKIREKGNGWTHVYAPSVVNKKLLEINPVTNQTYLEDMKMQLTDGEYTREVMAEFGDEASGVYKKRFLDLAMAEGDRIGLKYTTEMEPEELSEYLSSYKVGPRILGVDWDKKGACTNMVCVQLDTMHRDVNGFIKPIFKILFRVEIPQSDFTYTHAINKIIELNKIYNFDWVAVDRGHGEHQVETLHSYGMSDKASGLHEKTIGVSFSETVAVRDPWTLKKDKKRLKPFMVFSCSQVVFERCGIVLNPRDKKLLEQFEEYKIVSMGSTGNPIFSDGEEHIVDATNLCLYMFERKYGNIFNQISTAKPVSLPPLIQTNGVVQRDTELINVTKKSSVIMLGSNVKNGYISLDRRKDDGSRVMRKPTNKMAMPKRSMF